MGKKDLVELVRKISRMIYVAWVKNADNIKCLEEEAIHRFLFDSIAKQQQQQV